MSDEYWIISVPGKSTPRQSYDEVCQATGRDQLSQNYLFNIPELKVKSADIFISFSIFYTFRLAHLIRLLLFLMTLLDLTYILKGKNRINYSL